MKIYYSLFKLATVVLLLSPIYTTVFAGAELPDNPNKIVDSSTELQPVAGQQKSGDNPGPTTKKQINPPFWFSLIIVGLLGLALRNSGMLFFLKRGRKSP
ncbi:hypothetical protein CMK14_09700 [Candidatus Poribacteria bacterium]|nr:hypothetical protein [Candidatus Poribacteria bacterium]